MVRATAVSVDTARTQQLGHRRRQPDRVDRMRDRAFGPGPGRQPCVVPTPDQQQDRWAAQNLVLELAAQPHSTRHRLAVQDREVDAARVHRGQHRRLGRHLEHPDWRQIGRHLAPQGEPDVFPRGPV